MALSAATLTHHIGTVVSVFGPKRPRSARPALPDELTLAAETPGPVTT